MPPWSPFGFVDHAHPAAGANPLPLEAVVAEWAGLRLRGPAPYRSVALKFLHRRSRAGPTGALIQREGVVSSEPSQHLTEDIGERTGSGLNLPWYVEGPTPRSAVPPQGLIAARPVARLSIEICDALDSALPHVHRDVRPANMPSIPEHAKARLRSRAQTRPRHRQRRYQGQRKAFAAPRWGCLMPS